MAIRTFWLEDGRLHFGTGGGITWDSTPEGEWAETELKAARLLRGGRGWRRGLVTVSEVWVNGGLVDPAPRRRCRPSTTGSPWATACSRR